MSFEAFETHLHPMSNLRLFSGKSVTNLDEITEALRAEWPEFHSDNLEIARLFSPLCPNERLLVYETSEGLIQVYVRQELEDGSFVFSLRFAYCNPRSVYTPYCAMVRWLMERYQLYCHVVSDLAPQHQGVADTIDSPENVDSLLIPGMDYNRRLWQLDAGTQEEAILRPGDAIARFMPPQYVSSGT